MYRSVSAFGDSRSRVGAFAAFFRTLLVVLSGIGESQPLPAPKANRLAGRSRNLTQQICAGQEKGRRKPIPPQAGPAWEGAGGSGSPPPAFTTFFSGATSLHKTPSASKVQVEEALRPAGVRRSSTTLPNPGIRVPLIRG